MDLTHKECKSSDCNLGNIIYNDKNNYL